MAAPLEAATGKERTMMEFGPPPLFHAAVASEARRAAEADAAQVEHENEDYEAAKARAEASRPRSRRERIRRLLRLGR
ncbi:MAG: hypothetical protein ABSE70_10570 [Candidatus Limnocylindrales bacterium]